MIKELFIQNLILMESCSLQWNSGLNVITGETGSGKTAILHGIRLLLGQKLDTSVIRKGTEKGFVQALFSFPFPEELSLLLSETGIPSEDSSLWIRREFSAEGKSRSWINDRAVSLALLQKVGAYCVQIVDQHACQELRASEDQRKILDRFAGLEESVRQFSLLHSQSKELEKTRSSLAELERQKERELPFYQAQIEELESISLEEGEEEALFEQYSMASSAEEVSQKIDLLFDLLSQRPSSALSQISQAKSLCKPFSSLHPSFHEAIELLESSCIPLQETLHLLQKVLSHFDPDPKRKEHLEQKLSQIDRMKKKYGSSLQDWAHYRQALQNKIDAFERIEEEKKLLETAEKELALKTSALSKEISAQRLESAAKLSTFLSKEVRLLNMSEAAVRIEVRKEERASSGEDSVHFWMTANRGEREALVKESSSGGELARLLLSLKLCLAEKNQTPTLIFDEIDSGVGGETARLIGEKLRQLSNHRQIVCITHFPQVACEAASHFKVEKRSEGERTFALVHSLDSFSKEQELLRMLGGKKTLSFYEPA